MNHEAKACGCKQDIGMSRAHIPHYCKHGHLLVYTKPLKRFSGFAPLESQGGDVVRVPRRRRGISAASKRQRDKVLGLPCAYCGQEGSDYRAIDPAHVWPRGKGGCDSPACVIPLCRTCHDRFDGRAQPPLELLPLLVQRGYFAEMAHPIAQHEVSPTQLVERLTVSEAAA